MADAHLADALRWAKAPVGRGVGLLVTFSAGLLSIALSGCHAAPTAAASAPAAAVAPQSPIEAFVTSAQPGQSTVLSDPKLGQVRVTVLKQYAAANGEYCRRFGVETAGSPGQVLVGVTCYDGTAWDPVSLAL